MSDVSIPNSPSFRLRPNRGWSSEEIEHLITLWREHEELYDLRHVDYPKRDRRRLAFKHISEQLGITVPEIKKKMTNLRTYYTKEIWKERPGGKMGTDEPSKEPYISRWQHIHSLSFLKENCVASTNDHPMVRSYSTSQMSPPEFDNDQNDDNEEIWEEGKDGEQVEVTVHVNGQNTEGEIEPEVRTVQTPISSTPLNTPSSTSHGRPEKRLKRTAENLETVIAKLHKNPTPSVCESTLDVAKNPDLVFASHVGLTLMNIKNQRTKELAKLKIQQALFEAQYSTPPTQVVVQEPQTLQIPAPQVPTTFNGTT
ncbi:predicted protein [Nematostella vectensis]|uniref:MADF domain-containing protein n=1 Tax=Nematostella vectensis TaxID=45351 RepID=A7SIZ1_NEMVE|nr:uncharacterized protein LOC5507740 [Nematostella vectensis]EDO36305.1 predicted protein [Nematostella vectensis]|eukprot:XP_001628368.1 predicted protein [Nematostella vectensis]